MEKLSTSYFTGSQCEIYIGDSLVGETLHVEGTLQTPHIPIYGYASRTFDSMSRGKVIVQGVLIINYVFDGYLFAHIKEASKTSKTNKGSKSRQLYTSQTIVAENNEALPVNEYYIKEHENLLYNIDDKMLESYKEKFWNENEINPRRGHSYKRNIRPEHDIPFDMIVRDFRIGSMDTDNYEEKRIVDALITSNGLKRTTEGGHTVEQYSFIARNII